MKRFLLSIILLCTVVLGNAQLVLNEVYNNPGGGKHEFFELYNPTPQAINADCYTLVAYYNVTKGNTNTRGFIVLNLPSMTVEPFGYLTGGSTNPINVQNITGRQVDFSWRNIGTEAGQDPTGYIRNYQVHPSLDAYNANAGIDDLNDIFRSIQSAELAVFLFNGSTYVNGIKAGFGSDNTIPAEIRAMPNLNDIPITTAAGVDCGATTFSINFKALPSMEFSAGAQGGGSDNGFAREFDGYCGTWVKTSNSPAHTPDRPNVAKSGTVLGTGSIKTEEKVLCGKQIIFTILNTTPTSQFPVTASIYVDQTGDKVLNTGDALLTRFTIPSLGSNNSSVTTIYDIPVAEQGKSYIIEYRSGLGCVDHIVPVVPATGTITTTAKSYCNQLIEYNITGGTGDAATYSFPVTVELHYDLNNNGTLDEGDEDLVVLSKEVTSASNTVYAFEVPDPSKNVLLVYKSAFQCFMPSPIKPTAVQDILSTTERIACGAVYYRVDGLTDAPTTVDVSPITVKLYGRDANGNITYLTEELYSTVPSNTYGGFDVTIYSGYTSYQLEYMVPGFDCLNETVATVPEANGDYITAERTLCNTQIEITVNGNGPDYNLLPSDAFKIYVYYDENDNQTYDAGVDGLAPEQPITVNTANTTNTYTIPIPTADQGKVIRVFYDPTLTCFRRDLVPAATTATLTTEEESFCGDAENPTRVSYRVVSATGDAANHGFPIRIDLYYDLNKNGSIDADENTVKQTKSTSTFMSTPDNFTLPLEDREQSAILVYTAVNDCFSRTAGAPSSCSVLPVVFKSFSAARNRQNQQQVDLVWEIAQEQNNKGFQVQRKTEGTWKNLGFVASAADNGNSTNALTYHFKDQNASKGISQYRLLQVDLDGKSSYSKEVAVRGLDQTASVVIYPNPGVNGTVSLLFSESGSSKDVLISDAAGRLVKRYTSVIGSLLTLNNLNAGYYTIRIVDRKTGTIKVEKLIMQ